MGCRAGFLVLTAICGCLALAAATPAGATFPGRNGKIAFSSNENAGNHEIWTMNPDGSSQTRVTFLGAEDLGPAWNAAGSLIAFTSDRAFGDFDAYRMDQNGGTLLTLTADQEEEESPAWAPTGSQLAISRIGPSGQSEVFVVEADGSGTSVNITNSGGFHEVDPSWSPDGTRIAFARRPDGVNQMHDIYTINPDGTGLQNVTNSPNADDREPNWRPDGSKLAYASFQNGNYDIYTIDPDGSDQTDVTNFPAENDRDPAWSPNGQRIAFVSSRGNEGNSIYVMNADGSFQTSLTPFSFVDDRTPDWQALPPLPPPGAAQAYARPKGATPFTVPYVVAYQQCGASNEQHGPPLAFASCASPNGASTAVTVGTPDANGAAANSVGNLRLDVVVGNPGAPDDSDVLVTNQISDVRCKGATTACGNANTEDGPDYTGQLQGNTVLRITDRFNAVSPGGGTNAATVVDIPFPFPMSCANSVSTTEGGLCTGNTSMNAIVPGAIKDGKRAVVELQQVQLLDGGPDGASATTPNTLFAVQGLFVP